MSLVPCALSVRAARAATFAYRPKDLRVLKKLPPRAHRGRVSQGRGRRPPVQMGLTEQVSHAWKGLVTEVKREPTTLKKAR
eukprot:1181747-Prorocentrum_minimum.AAC.2